MALSVYEQRPHREETVSDSIIYEAQPIPPEDPGDSSRRRRSAIFGGIALVALLLVGVAFGAALFRGDPEPDPVADTEQTERRPVTTTTSIASPFSSLDQRGGDSISRPARPGGDVGTPTPALPQQTFTWEKVTLDIPAAQEGWLQGVYATEDGFLAIALVWSDPGQQMLVWRSADGSSWERTELNGDFSGASVWNIQFTEYGGIAFGEAMHAVEGAELYREPRFPERLVWTSRDGVTWTRHTLKLETADNESVWINTGAVGPDGFVVVGSRETSPEFGAMTISKDGYTLEISEYDYTYRLLDASGQVVAAGSLDDVYGGNYDLDGQVVAHPDTGEIIVIVPWQAWEEAWEQAYNESRGGPFGGYGYNPPIVTIEHDGYRITIDEEAQVYTVENVASGEVIASGRADYLWRGPAPVITDETGNELLRFTWEEFDRAQQAFWANHESEYEYGYRSEPVIAISTDGVTWTEVDGPAKASQSVSFDTVIYHNGRFIAYGNQWDEYTGGSAIWTSPDGRTWSQAADMPGGMYIWNVKVAADGTLLALGDGPQGSALWSSPDGLSWGEAFGTRIPEDRTMYEWMNQFGTGQLGTVVLGSREQQGGEYFADPLTLTQGDYTLTFDDYDVWPPRVTVVDDTTGETIIDLRLADEGETGLPEGFAYADGVTTISHNGVVLMSIDDDDWYAAQEARWMEIEGAGLYQDPTTTMYFSSDLDTWTEVPLDLTGWINQVAVGSSAVVLAGEEFVGEEYFSGEGDHYLVHEPRPPVLWVGRP